MIKESEKTGNIIHELSNFFTNNGIFEYTINVCMSEEMTKISISGHCNKAPESLQELCDTLNGSERIVAMEDYYEQLLGIHDEENEFSLLAAMVDTASATYANQILTINICRLIY